MSLIVTEVNKCGLFAGGDGYEHNIVGLREICKIFAAQEDF